MLYELATGQRPFQGETSMSTISSILKDDPKSITELNASLPRHLGRIVRRCLAKEPDRRYQTTLDLRNELEALSQEVASGELVTGAQSAPVIGRSTRTWAVLAIAAAVLIAGTLLIVKLTGGLSSQPTAGVRQGMKRLMTQGEPFSVAISPDGHYVAHSNVSENQWTLSVTQVSTTSPVELLATKDGILDVSFAPDGQFVYYRTGDTLFRIPFLGGHPTRVLDQVKEVGLSPDGSRVAITTFDIPAHLFVSNLDGTDRQKISSEAHDFLGYPAWSPDGTRVAFVTDSSGIVDLREVSTIGGEETLLGEPWANFSGLAWAPDGKRLILAGADGWGADPQALWEVSYPAGRATRITTDLSSYRSPSLSADGTTLASVRSVSRSTVWVVSTDRTQPPQRILFRSGQSDHFGVSWMADGRILYGSDASGNADCWIMNAEGSGARRLTLDPGADYSPVATPDGESIVFVSNRSGATNLWTMRLDGSSAQQLTRGGADTQPDVSPDGRWVVYNCGRFPAAVCRIPIDGGDAEKLSRDLDDLHGAGPAISPDGTRIAYLTPDNGTEIISIDGGDVLGQQPAYTAQDWNVDRWTPDGKNLTHVYWNDGVPNISTIPVGGGEDDDVQRTFLDHRDYIHAFAWSPDGTQLVIATGGESSEVVLLEGF
jgi:TolB protein